ncbi:glycoside hydrolase family 3 protein [Clavulina sp. PMI_390]|nr:glycoside hydrolase family 3 protein [Clavulina sp. PMI_390]
MPSAPYTPPLPGSRNSTRSPLVRGEGIWAEPVRKAKALVAKLTNEEKANLTTGNGWQIGQCVGNTPPIASINFPGLCLQDSPLGVRFADLVTGFPAAINAAATWDRQLIRNRGKAMGYQHRTKGSNVQLGPMMNMGRNAQGGRNWEGFGADPYLTGEGAYETILGIQSMGVQACAKHYIGNEQEHNRTAESSNIDDKTIHEVYAAPFLRSVQAGVASAMCSYSSADLSVHVVNGTYACDNDYTMNVILKGQFGFQGYIMSDWQATMSTLGAEAGLDMTMPGDIVFDSGTTYFGKNLTDYVANGTIAEARLTDMATRILAAWFLTGQDDDYPATNFDSWNVNGLNDLHVQAQTNFTDSAYEVAVASHILLKNTNGTLPLVTKSKMAPKKMVLVGSDAGPPKAGPNEFPDRGGYTGTLAMGWGSGTANFSRLVSPLEGIQPYAKRDKTNLEWTFDDFNLQNAGDIVQYKDVAIVFISADSGEDYITVDGNEGDRKNLTSWYNGDALVDVVAGNNSNTIVVVHSVGPLILESWIDHPNVTAVIWAGLPGEASGDALADILYGNYNPSGKLPFTIAKQATDYNGGIITDSDPTAIKQVPYTERVFIDYRHFDEAGITPRFEFGFGLSYTTFEYSNLKIKPRVHGNEGRLEEAWEKGNVIDTTVGASTAAWLHQSAYHVTYTVTNNGSVAGHEVSQLYLAHPPGALEPPSILRGFQRTWLEPGESATVSHNLTRYDLSLWNTVEQGWSRSQGTIGVMVGASSRDFRLKGTIPK